MPRGRISKLLRTEYQDLASSESLLLESPFAETTRDGRGLREVALGLTASRLIVAGDNLDNRVFWCEKHVDPSIESLELKSVLPLEYVTLTISRAKKRRALEARLVDGRKKYYELGGLGCRSRSWNDWCRHVRRLLRDSETSNARGRACEGWTRKYLYLGPEYEELWDRHYCPKPSVFAGASLETIGNDLTSPRPIVRPPPPARLRVPAPRPTSSSGVVRHRLTPAPHFLRGFGPWSANHGDRVSLQSRLTQSLADVRRPDPELRLPISRRQLARATASLASSRMPASTPSPVLFWTTDYWYRPRDAVRAYGDARRHLNGISIGQRPRQRTHLRGLLRLQRRISLRDISGASLARQLTLVERDLFARISVDEVRDLARYREPRDAPNFSAWVAFAHRIACLLESQALRIAGAEERARIVARLIAAAERCVEDGNFQSASSIVAALQSPAMFRLKATWSYLEERHSTKYKAMTKLIELFANVKSRTYHEAWMKIENSRCSSIPSVADVVARILGLKDVGWTVDGDLKILGIRFGCQKPRDRIDRLVGWLQSCQSRARNYNHAADNVTWEFLLKTRYRESRDNFLSSFNLE